MLFKKKPKEKCDGFGHTDTCNSLQEQAAETGIVPQGVCITEAISRMIIKIDDLEKTVYILTENMVAMKYTEKMKQEHLKEKEGNK